VEGKKKGGEKGWCPPPHDLFVRRPWSYSAPSMRTTKHRKGRNGPRGKLRGLGLGLENISLPCFIFYIT